MYKDKWSWSILHLKKKVPSNKSCPYSAKNQLFLSQFCVVCVKCELGNGKL